MVMSYSPRGGGKFYSPSQIGQPDDQSKVEWGHQSAGWMETIGKCECLNRWAQELLWEALSEMKSENQKLAFAAKQGMGDSPFTLCMRAAASGPVRSPDEQRDRFGRAGTYCRSASRKPEDLVPYYKEKDEVMMAMMKELVALPACTGEHVPLPPREMERRRLDPQYGQ